MSSVESAVALAKLYIQSGDQQSASKTMNQIKDKLSSDSLMGKFDRMLTAEVHLEKEDYDKVEECLVEIDRIIELGYNMLASRKNKILAQLYEKKTDFKNANEFD